MNKATARRILPGGDLHYVVTEWCASDEAVLQTGNESWRDIDDLNFFGHVSSYRIKPPERWYRVGVVRDKQIICVTTNLGEGHFDAQSGFQWLTDRVNY